MSEDLRSKIDSLTAEMRLLNKRLQSESFDQPGSLSDFREALDTLRLTAWTVHELSRARQTGGTRVAEVLVVTANERARRFREMAATLCADLDKGFLQRDVARDALENRIEALRTRLLLVDREPAA